MEIARKNEQQRKDNCETHKNKKSFFCETCQLAICGDCTVLGHKKTDGHVIAEISDVEATHRQALLGQINDTLVSLTQVQGKMQELELEMALLIAAKETTNQEVHKFIEVAHKKLEERRNEPIKINEETFTERHNTLLNKQKPLQKAIDLLSKNLNQAKKLMKNDTHKEIIEISQNLMNITDCQLHGEMNFAKNFISLDSNKGMSAVERSLGNMGEISIAGFLPAKYEFKLKEPRASGKADIHVKLFSHRGEPVPVTASHFVVEITDPYGVQIESVLNTTGHECTVTFTPQLSGLHKVYATFLGKELNYEKNQISVSSNNPVMKLGGNGKGNGFFSYPRGIAIDNDNCLYVVDTGNRLIQKFKSDGQFISQFSVAAHNKRCTTFDVALDMNRGLIICMETFYNNQFVVGGRVYWLSNRMGSCYINTPLVTYGMHVI